MPKRIAEQWCIRPLFWKHFLVGLPCLMASYFHAISQESTNHPAWGLCFMAIWFISLVSLDTIYKK